MSYLVKGFGDRVMWFIVYLIGCVISYGLTVNFWFNFYCKYSFKSKDVQAGDVLIPAMCSWYGVVSVVIITIYERLPLYLKWRLKSGEDYDKAQW